MKPATPDTMLQLNDPQRNTLLAAIREIDRLLAEATAGLADASDGALFAPTVPDATPTQCKVIGDQVARLRRAMRNALELCAIPVRPPTLSAVWGVRTALTFVDIALEDFGADHLRGYGPIDESTVESISALRAQMRTVVTELQRYLDSDLGGDLAVRIARLDQTTDEVRLLRELERIITAHGLVEFREALTLLLDRLERNWWVVAFVGRVSSGKSSLLNHLLETGVLPAGVTPITAVPIRIVHGAKPGARVSFASDPAARVPAGQLAEYASEEHNPGNARHVTDILLELPSPRLAGDICFVDTPGLGSIATAGAVQTLAFLPRCDLGVFLLDSGSTLAAEDIAVLRTLIEGGAEVSVVLSKADLLTTPDREKLIIYIGRQLQAALGREVAVHPVSVTDGHAEMTEAWFAGTLAPMQRRHRELAAATLRRKAGALREAVVAVLASSTAGGFPPARPLADFGTARATLERIRRELYDLTFGATPGTDSICDRAADELTKRPGSFASDEFPAAVAAVLVQEASRLGEAFDRLLRDARGQLLQVLPPADAPADAARLPEPFSQPLFDPSPVLGNGGLALGWQRWPTVAARRGALRRHLRNQIAPALENALRVYGRILVSWSQRYLEELTTQFNAEAGFFEAHTAASGPPLTPGLADDLALLRHWPVTTKS